MATTPPSASKFGASSFPSSQVGVSEFGSRGSSAGHDHIAFIGGGNMASAIIGGLVKKGVPANHIVVVEPWAEARAKLLADFAITALDTPGPALDTARTVVWAVKPQMFKDAAEKLTGFSCRCGVVHFDMNKSGARLAWEFFFPEQAVPDLVRFVEDRDIWVWQYPESPGFLAALDMELFEFERWKEIATFNADELASFVNRGKAMDEKFTKLASIIADGAQALTLNGVPGLMVNAPGVFHSLVGETLSKQSGTFALMWSIDKTGVVKAGLRSQRSFDCIALAESLGGGGHAQACGFKMGAERLPELLSGQFEANR